MITTILSYTTLLIVAIGFYVWTVRRGSLTAGGAICALALGAVVVGTAGWWYLLPLLVFFGSSVLIGKLLPAKSAHTDEKQGKARDAVQVLANGGLYGVVAAGSFILPDLFGQGTQITHLTLLSLAAVATADTWSSEVGQYLRQPTFDVLRLRPVPVGLSGGVSVGGTVAGAGGAALLAGLAALSPVQAFAWTDVIIVFTAGFVGMLLDSLLGSWLQATYRLPGGQLTDRPEPGSVLFRGYRWICNDAVNLLAILLVYLLLTFVLTGAIYPPGN